MSRDIKDLSIGHLLNYHPPNFVDSTDSQIEMGKNDPFKNDPIEDVKLVYDKITGDRWGFTDRYHVHACEDSPEVKRIKEIIGMRMDKRSKRQIL